MRLIPAAGLTFLFGSIALSGLNAQQSYGVMRMGLQTQATSSAQATGCPVALRAQHLADGSIVKTRDSALHNGHPAGIGQWMHLTLANSQEKRATAAVITVHGMSGRGHLTGAQAAGGMASDIARDLSVQFKATSENEVTADVWVPGMTAVQQIDVRSLAYANGETWQISGSGACHVTPDPLMLVDGR
jgi:hypothetical protein